MTESGLYDYDYRLFRLSETRRNLSDKITEILQLIGFSSYPGLEDHLVANLILIAFRKAHELWGYYEIYSYWKQEIGSLDHKRSRRAHSILQSFWERPPNIKGKMKLMNDIYEVCSLL